MTARELLHPESDSMRRWATEHALDRAERFLLISTACVLLFVFMSLARSAVTADAPPETAMITVQAGDTLWELAGEYGDPNQYILERVNALAKANGLKRGEVLREGQTLVIPVTNRSAKLYYGGKYASREIAN